METRMTVAAAILLAVAAGTTMAAPWHRNICLDGGGYWSVRVPVEVENPADKPLKGVAVTVALRRGEGTEKLLGLPVASLRAVLESGTEVIFGLQGANGLAKRDGVLAEGDTVTVPVEVPARGRSIVYLYAGNDRAWLPPDWLRGGLANGGFELGTEGTPAAWSTAETDARHRMYRQRGGAHSGEWCARCEVDEGAENRWTKYHQTEIPVTEGATYRFSGWVKAENVKGTAGWFIHVNGVQPMMINRVEGQGGTFDWREIVIEFTVPEGGQTFVCGTVLWGTGTAWYDDAKLEIVEAAANQPRVRVLAAETLRLRKAETRAEWPRDTTWQWRVPLYLRNFSDDDVRSAMASFEMLRVANTLGKLIGFGAEPGMMLIDPAQGDQPQPIYGSLSRGLSTVVSVPARSEKVLWLYLSRDASATVGRSLSPPENINLCRNGDMEQGEDERPEAWRSNVADNPDRAGWTRRVPGGVSGQWCLELTVPKDATPAWAGWTQRVPVEPNKTYTLSGYIKCRDMDGETVIYGHLLKEDGSLCEQWSLGTAPGVSGDRDWTYTSVTFTTPPDCAALEIHLTTNRHGTIWHDAVVLAAMADAAGQGVVGDLEARKTLERPVAWGVDTAVKVFASDLPPADPQKELILGAARNEYEACQVAVRSPKANTLQIVAEPLSGPGGTTIAAPAIYHVGRVPIDFPIGYDSTRAPSYHRMKPRSRGNDGWAGWWPDPMIPVRDGQIRLDANTTEALYFDYYVPANAPPGEYRGAVELKCGSEVMRLPVRLRVWNFTQPVEKHLPAIYDYRPTDRDEATDREWQAFLKRYNVSGGYVVPPPDFRYEDGRVTADFSRFDEMAAYMLDELRINKVYTPWIFYACGWAYPPKKLFGLEPGTPEYAEAFREAYRLFIDHITEKGWRNKFVYYISDEPHANSQVTIEGINRLCDLAREIAPDVLIYSSTWGYIPGLEGHLTLWGIGPQGTFPADKIAERRAAGDHFWFTTDGQMCTDTPFLAIERLLPWLCFKYDVEAYEFWGSNWYTYDPWKYGWHSYISQSSEGKEYYYVRYPNGDGFLAYPGKPIGEKGPVPSIRLVAAREGLDDYEIFLALRAWEEKGSAEAREALDRIRELVQIPNAGGRCSTGLMEDPAAFTAARMAAGEVLSRLEGQ